MQKIVYKLIVEVRALVALSLLVELLHNAKVDIQTNRIPYFPHIAVIPIQLVDIRLCIRV